MSCAYLAHHELESVIITIIYYYYDTLRHDTLRHDTLRRDTLWNEFAAMTADCHTPIRFRQTCSSGSLVSLATGTCLLAASPYSLCLPFWNYGAPLFVMFALGNASRVDVKGLAIQAQVYWQLCYPAYEVC